MEAKVGDVVLLRMANLGSLRHSVTVDGIPLRVIGADASQLKSADSDNSFVTNSIEIAPGESRDVLLTAPAVGTYRIYDRNFANLSNNGDAGYGGMLTELRVSA
jgi:uncharacterized cupredoxin-like copper-binding protein